MGTLCFGRHARLSRAQGFCGLSGTLILATAISTATGSSAWAASGTLSSDITLDFLGLSQTVSATPIVQTNANPFFENFGTNGRVCGTCHVEQEGWTLSPIEVAFGLLTPNNPLFVFDGSDCLPPGEANSNPLVNSREMLTKALIRIDLPIPAGADYTLTDFSDPHACPTPPNSSDVRMYRRPLPASNTVFLSTVMWDGRENVTTTIAGDLAHQANDATTGHAQATAPLSTSTQAQMVGFETGLFNAQSNLLGLPLDSLGANGGATFLESTVSPAFAIGVNNPLEPGFSSEIFHEFTTWEPANLVRSNNPLEDALRASIGRGEVLFNTTSFTIDNVNGLNQDPSDPIQGPFVGFCGTCHNNPDVGNHSTSLPLDIGITAVQPVGGLDVSGLPIYTFTSSSGQTISVTDPGRGLVTGKFKDLGKTKGPNLRNLAARPPYFHNGSAPDLLRVVSFYNARFNIGFTTQQATDLATFLSAL